MADTPEKPKPKPQRDPFLPPLDPGQLREFFRRLASQPPSEQQAFVKRINWNLLDAATEHQLFGWLIDALRSRDEARQAFALEQLEKMPHHRRGRHAPHFEPLLAELPPELARRLADAFGPVLGGAPKRPKGPQAPKKQPPRPEPKPDRAATGDDLAKLQNFFDRFGGAR